MARGSFWMVRRKAENCSGAEIFEIEGSCKRDSRYLSIGAEKMVSGALGVGFLCDKAGSEGMLWTLA